MAGRRWVALAGVAVVLTGCAHGGDKSTEASAIAPRGESGGTALDSAGSPVASSPTGAVEKQPAVLVVARPQEVVYTADLRVVAADVAKAAAAAQRIVTEQGGFVFGQDSTATGAATATLTLKVPPLRFSRALSDLSHIGKEQNRHVTAEDVSAEGADLDARIVSAQRSVDRMRGFLDQTHNVNELAGVEAELTRRETALEQLVGQRRVLSGQVSLATVNLTISEKPVPAKVVPAGDPLRKVPGFGAALSDGVDWLIKAGRVVGAGLGYLLPFALVLAIPMTVARVRRRGRHPAAA